MRTVEAVSLEAASSEDRRPLTNVCETPHCLAITAFVHPAHSSSASMAMTALRLSALVRRKPWIAFAPKA